MKRLKNNNVFITNSWSIYNGGLDIIAYSDILKDYLEKRESEVVDIMMQLYDHEEVMRVHDIGVARDSAIRTAVEMCQDFGMTFMDAVEKIAAKFSFSKERAESGVSEYWNE